MARTLIGLVVGVTTNTVYSVVNPDDDAELDDPCHLDLQNVRGEQMRMVKVPRAHYHHPDNEASPINCSGEMSADDVYQLIVRWYVETAEIETRGDFLESGAI